MGYCMHMPGSGRYQIKPMTPKPNHYKVPKSWADALRKGCIESFHIEENNEFVCVWLADGWRDADNNVISIHCHYENEGNAWQEALEYLQDKWPDIEYHPCKP